MDLTFLFVDADLHRLRVFLGKSEASAEHLECKKPMLCARVSAYRAEARCCERLSERRMSELEMKPSAPQPFATTLLPRAPRSLHELRGTSLLFRLPGAGRRNGHIEVHICRHGIERITRARVWQWHA